MEHNATAPLGQVTEQTLALAKAALAKNVTISTGLTAYDLQAPAKNLYPTITPIRNRMPRVQRATPGDAARWRTINAITGSGYDAMPWIPESQRSGSMSYTAAPVTAAYMTIGEEDTISFEAEAAAVGYEDINATATMRLLQKTMVKEESGLLRGNASLSLGTPAQPALSQATLSGATLPTLNPYSVIVVALTAEGYANSSLTGGVATTNKITGNDGNNYTLNGGSSLRSPNNTQAITLGQALYASVTPIQGAVAYAWYVGAAGAETLQAITTINSAVFSTPLIANQQPATAVGGQDFSRNAGLAFDGLLTIAFNPANNAYFAALPTGTAGTGTFLTGSGRGSVNEIDNMLLSMWNNYRLSPTVLYVHAQEQKNITTKCLTNASGPLLRYDVAANRDGGGPYGLMANGTVRWYYNPYSVDGGTDIPIMVHPNLPPGTLIGWCERLPAWYQSNEVANPLEVLTRRDYYRIDWPIRTRRREYGVYAEEVLAAYAPFAVGAITNIANG